jgi:hypothetical protein
MPAARSDIEQRSGSIFQQLKDDMQRRSQRLWDEG